MFRDDNGQRRLHLVVDVGMTFKPEDVVVQVKHERQNMQSINQSEPVTPRRHWGTHTDAPAVMVAHRRLYSATRGNDDNDWPVHSLILPFHDLRGLPLRRLQSTEPCSMVFGSVSWR